MAGKPSKEIQLRNDKIVAEFEGKIRKNPDQPVRKIARDLAKKYDLSERRILGIIYDC